MKNLDFQVMSDVPNHQIEIEDHYVLLIETFGRDTVHSVHKCVESANLTIDKLQFKTNHKLVKSSTFEMSDVDPNKTVGG